ncbi:hypothetical protein BST11_06940 [Mycobacterium alsense]|uniref:PE family protein n=2 Tax=Mycobacterium alsense TaxID=324058 RepID=A0AA42BZI1_9MYCO|nr:PE family protein [Mycobacterium alsense]MCV7380770.1 PE family protein [Mycobacterium alsense]OQZ91902.1 hypothetical protein BST11_06940 [Mycobacterium alsense]
MSLVSVTPDVVGAASANLEEIGSSLRAAHAAAAAQTTAIAAPAADEISQAITSFFGTAAREYQALSSRAAVFHETFVSTLNGGVVQYLTAEAANVQQTLINAVNGPAEALLGHPLIGPAPRPIATMAAAATAAESLNTPFGPISFTFGGTPPSGPDMTGPFSGWVNATTPLGAAQLSLSGMGLGSNTYQVTGGSLNWPLLATLLSTATSTGGPAVSGGGALLSSLQTAFTAAAHGDLLGAATAVASAPGNVLNGILFGSQSVTIPLDTSSLGGPTVNVNVPYPGLFASPQPITVSWPEFSYTPTGGPTYTVLGASNLPLQGTEVPGLVPLAANTIGAIPAGIAALVVQAATAIVAAV